MNLLPSKRLRPYVRVAFWAIFILLILHWITVIFVEPGSVRANTLLGSLFDLDREYNIPTAVNSLLLFTSATLSLLLASKAKKIQRIGWVLFASLFGYLALDELLILHEQLAEPLRKILNITGSNPLYHAWVIPAIGVIVIFLLTTFSIKRYHRELAVFSNTLILVAILAAGVVTCEILGTFIYNNMDMYRWVMVPIEEVFELSMSVLIASKLLGLYQEGTNDSKKKKTA